MSDRVPVEQFLGLLHERERDIERELADIDGRKKTHNQTMSELRAKLDAARDELVHALLPDLTPQSIQHAVALSGYVPMRNQDPIAIRESERGRLEARLAEIRADERYRDRELLRAPRVGTLSRQIIELEDFSTTLTDSLNRAAHIRIQRLIDSGYDTDAYATGWWRASYYADWKAGDEILARFPGKKRFAEVREEYLQARDSLEVYNTKLAELRKQVAIGVGLEKEHDRTRSELDSLEHRHLVDWRRKLGDYLVDLDPGDVGERLQREPELALLAKRVGGIKHQMDYLKQIVAQADTIRQALVEERSKIGREKFKWSRPKHTWAYFDAASVNKRFRERPAKMRQRRERVWTTYETVSRFDRYDRARFIDDFLWWDLMTDGRIDGDFIPGVRTFHDHHPNYAYQRIDRDLFDDDRAGGAAAAVAGADRMRDGDPTTNFDAS